jgi:hypothetical protein
MQKCMGKIQTRRQRGKINFQKSLVSLAGRVKFALPNENWAPWRVTAIEIVCGRCTRRTFLRVLLGKRAFRGLAGRHAIGFELPQTQPGPLRRRIVRIPPLSQRLGATATQK